MIRKEGAEGYISFYLTIERILVLNSVHISNNKNVLGLFHRGNYSDQILIHKLAELYRNQAKATDKRQVPNISLKS